MAITGAIAVPHPPLIVPAVGCGEEARIQATTDAYRRAVNMLLETEPDCLVVTSPHAPLFRDAFHITTDPSLHGSMARFHAPQERINAPCNFKFAEALVERVNEAGILAVGSDRYADDMDHGTFVPLYFVREAWRDRAGEGDLPCPIVRIGLSGLSPKTHRQLGRVIAQVADEMGLRVGFIASGDLSHRLLEEGPYGFAPEGPVFDERIQRVFESGNLDGLFEFDEAFCDAAGECGIRSFQIMTGALDGMRVKTQMISNEGPFGVGYGVATCMPLGAQREGAADGQGQQVDPCIALARLSVETFVKTGVPAKTPADVPSELADKRAGVFVSLHENGELRGCIGTIVATTGSIAEEILRNGVHACSEDPRFAPAREDELDYLEYSVDVLGAPEPIDSPAQLDAGRYGVIVTQGLKRGLLLPNLDGIDSVDVQLEIAKRKAGIDPADENVGLERFEVVRHTRGGQPRRAS